jgi:uncharacterized protein (TIGR04222 family)
MSPLDLNGEQFLRLFIVGGVVVAVVMLVIRGIVARSPVKGVSADEIAVKLHGTELAFLLYGVERAVEAAIAGLHHRGTLVIKDGMVATADGGPFRGAFLDSELSTIERYVMNNVAPPQTVSGLVAGARHFDYELTDQFRAQGLMMSSRDHARMLIALPGLFWFVFGGVKVLIGLSRDRTVSYLVILLLGLLVGVAFLSKPPRLTSLGDAVTNYARNRTYGLSATAKTAPQQLSGYDMSLAYALYGTDILVGSALTALMPSYQRALLAATTSSSWSDTSSSSCSSSCGSSCSGGCGGGCGGCS